ncbi:molybdopterin converting factor subunit 1 [Methyloligella sp. 2.7D]|uniref:molybdopterin converting factor subunit 1 n=1 Tax=unclassified Methyloligella TaxID=2625955 RepID=UPI00157BFF2F|nr:molybdopterin converting factor subunit 1 [Methyloligella sp. GL2]QKP77048.1 molybdopterin converting factor subunit 1 [Methyloligella sp. GL2]
MRLLYFAWVREKAGLSSEEVELPADVTTVAELMAWQKTRGQEFASAFERAEVIRAAVDQAHAKPETEIAGASEIAFFPPVTGG